MSHKTIEELVLDDSKLYDLLLQPNHAGFKYFTFKLEDSSYLVLPYELALNSERKGVYLN